MRDQEIIGLWEAYQQVYAQPEEVEQLDERTAMAKRGYDETPLRRPPGGGGAADRAIALRDASTFGGSTDPKARQRLANSQMGDFRQTVLSGGSGSDFKSPDLKIQNLQAARARQRGGLTPNEIRRLYGSSSLPGVGLSGAIGRYQVGGSQGYGIGNTRLADDYEYDIHGIDPDIALISAEQVHTQPQEEVKQLDEITASMGRRAKKYRQDQAQAAHMANVEKHQEKMKNDPKYREEHERLRTVHSRRANGGDGEDQKESVDLFDYLLEYLVAEGYADTNKAALVIMANMSEEWKQSIMEGPGGMMMSAASKGRGEVTVDKTPRPAAPRGPATGPGSMARPQQSLRPLTTSEKESYKTTIR